jgi:hypothetical protein
VENVWPEGKQEQNAKHAPTTLDEKPFSRNWKFHEKYYAAGEVYSKVGS